MNVPTDRLLLMVVVLTGFAVLVAGWAGGLVEAEAGGWQEMALWAGLGVALLVVLLGVWRLFGSMDRGDSR